MESDARQVIALLRAAAEAAQDGPSTRELMRRAADCVERLQTENAALREDKERMDWLETRVPLGGVCLIAEIYALPRDAGHPVLIDPIYHWDCETRSVDDEPEPHHGKTAREAIDAAVARIGQTREADSTNG